MASTIATLSPSDLIYDRADAALAELAKATPVAHLESLVTHADSRVRACAVALLALKHDPHALPVIAALAADSGMAPPARAPTSFARIEGRRVPPTWCQQPQTVGDIASAVVGAYMDAAGYHHGVFGEHGQPGFAAYWAPRAERKHCLSWFVVARMRASRGTTPLPANRLEAIATLRRTIDALETPYREWTLLALAATTADPGSEALAPEEDLVGAAQRLGGERLMRLLRGEDPFPDDPDMRLGEHSAFPYEGVALLILRHARTLLGKEHASELLELDLRTATTDTARRGRQVRSARWATAAADLAPARAQAILHAAFDRFRSGTGFHDQDQRAILAAALWQHGGDQHSELAFLLDWFFGDEPQPGAFGFGRNRFTRGLVEPDCRLLLAILRDERLRAVDWQTLRGLATAANASAGTPIVTDAELSEAWHPLGEGHYHWNRDHALAAYPKETRDLEATLARWRKQLARFARSVR